MANPKYMIVFLRITESDVKPIINKIFYFAAAMIIGVLLTVIVQMAIVHCAKQSGKK